MSFTKVDIVLPNEIKEYYAATPEEKQAELHADFKNAINAAKINFEKVRYLNTWINFVTHSRLKLILL